MILVVLSILVGLLTGFGAMQELIVRGIIDRELQPLIISLVGVVVSVLFLTSGLAMWRQWPGTRRLVVITAIVSILFHVYAALPPHRNVGPVALIVGAGYGLVLLIFALIPKGKTARPVNG